MQQLLLRAFHWLLGATATPFSCWISTLGMKNYLYKNTWRTWSTPSQCTLWRMFVAFAIFVTPWLRTSEALRPSSRNNALAAPCCFPPGRGQCHETSFSTLAESASSRQLAPPGFSRTQSPMAPRKQMKAKEAEGVHFWSSSHSWTSKLEVEKVGYTTMHEF